MRTHLPIMIMVSVALTLAPSCMAPPQLKTSQPAPGVTNDTTQMTEVEVQALVMEFADEYNAALGEAIYLVVRSGNVDPTGRWLAQSFLRNGMSATLDIAAGPNPDVALLDLLVLTSLHTWSFGEHWIPAGIGEPGRGALERLRQADSAIWTQADRVLTTEQKTTLRELIDHWIENNRDRVVVSFVRFEDFADARLQTSAADRQRAWGLLREVEQASAAVDNAVLFGERVLWDSARYPFVLGQQTELTAYRIADQPETREFFETLEAIREAGRALAGRSKTIDRDLADLTDRLITRITAEREGAIEQSRQALGEVLTDTLEDLQRRVAEERDHAIGRAFDRFAQERTALLDDIQSRQAELRDLMIELRDTIGVSTGLAQELTGTVDAIDRVVSRFDHNPEDTAEPLKVTDVRDAAVEIRGAAERLTQLLQLTNEIAKSGTWDARLGQLQASTAGAVDRLFWRGVWLVVLLVAGLGGIRLIPQRHRSA